MKKRNYDFAKFTWDFFLSDEYLQQIKLNFSQKVDPDNIYFINLLSNHDTTGH